jgi:hypothetical protein
MFCRRKHIQIKLILVLQYEMDGRAELADARNTKNFELEQSNEYSKEVAGHTN